MRKSRYFKGNANNSNACRIDYDSDGVAVLNTSVYHGEDQCCIMATKIVVPQNSVDPIGQVPCDKDHFDNIMYAAMAEFSRND